MLRRSFLAAVVCAAAAYLTLSARADGPIADGNYVLSTNTPIGDQALCILKIETKDGKPSVSVPFSPANTETTIADFKATDKEVSFTVKQLLTFKSKDGKEQKFPQERKFVGAPGKQPKEVLGSLGTDAFPTRAKLTATDKQKLERDEMIVRGPAADTMQTAQTTNTKALLLQNQARREKDAAKKKDLMDQAKVARAEADEKVPALYREVVTKFADTPTAIDAATSLLGSGEKYKVTTDEAAKLVAVIQKQAAPFGPRYSRVIAVRTADTLVKEKGLATTALPLIEPVAKSLDDKIPTADQFDILTTYKAALAAAGKVNDAKAIDARLTTLDQQMDKEYLATVPPFKPTMYAGRKEKGANQVAVMELFTGAQCPPCVAADVGFDALLKAYKPSELVLIQYHVHIPGPDPMTNPETLARWDYYEERFPEGMRGAPSTVFNGKPAAGGGGGMTNSEAKFTQYSRLIDPLLEKTTPVKVGGKATRSGDKLQIAVEVNGLESTDDLKLRLLVVEDTVKFVGGNRIRFHHHVVRAMPGGAAGVAIKDKSMKHTATADLSAIRTDLTKYLDDYAVNERPFPKPERPLEMKNLKVIALVQSDKTAEIIQAVQIDVEGRPAGAGGR